MAWQQYNGSTLTEKDGGIVTDPKCCCKKPGLCCPVEPSIILRVFSGCSECGDQITQTPWDYNEERCVWESTITSWCGQPEPIYLEFVCAEYPEATTCDGQCTYEWDGSQWNLLLADCEAGCFCSGPPPFPGVAVDQQVNRPCITNQDPCNGVISPELRENCYAIWWLRWGFDDGLGGIDWMDWKNPDFCTCVDCGIWDATEDLNDDAGQCCLPFPGGPADRFIFQHGTCPDLCCCENLGDLDVTFVTDCAITIGAIETLPLDPAETREYCQPFGPGGGKYRVRVDIACPDPEPDEFVYFYLLCDCDEKHTGPNGVRLCWTINGEGYPYSECVEPIAASCDPAEFVFDLPPLQFCGGSCTISRVEWTAAAAGGAAAIARMAPDGTQPAPWATLGPLTHKQLTDPTLNRGVAPPTPEPRRAPEMRRGHDGKLKPVVALGKRPQRPGSG